MAVVKMLTRKKFGKGALEATMHSAWGSDWEVVFRELEPNLFLLQAFCLGDWKRIMEDDVWIQIHNIPPVFRTQTMIKQLASRVGEVLAIDAAAVPTSRGDFFRVRRRTKDMQFGMWMLADETLWRPDTPGMRSGRGFGGQGGGRGGHSSGSRGGRFEGRGRDGERVFCKWWPQQPTNSGGRKRSSTDAGLHDDDDLTNTTSSPLKTPSNSKPEEHGNASAKKHLDMDAASQMENMERIPPPPPQYITPREQKKMSKTKGGDVKNKGVTNASTSNAGSVASLEEDRREQ
ncbi:hypothetical protein BRADI_1g44976v3 [Brachypodium distachyon]|uniref:Uncharacterized protein n=1 Tax=Brachypodium distachyon TaxID=15368 RepID=A0A2K2DPD7_BRADI|nr:hypothetical protein BRADI_1g44976v3 [Brachypodium distachyon]